MTQLEEFQKQHGAEWARILQSTAFSAGMIHLSISFLEKVRQMSDEEIVQNSIVVLADLRGKMKYESALIELGVPVEEPPPEITEEYVNQIAEFNAEQERINRPPK